MIRLPSDRQSFSGFGSFFAAELEPLLAKREIVRKRALRDAFAICVPTAIIALLIIWKLGPDLGHIIAAIAATLGFGAAAARLSKAREEITHDVLEKIATRMGFQYLRSLSRPAYCATFERLGLLPRFNIEEWEDAIAGTHDGVDFTLVETHLKYRTKGKKRQTRTVFHGQLLVIDYHQDFAGETVIKRDADLLNRFTRPDRKFQNVGLASPVFEKAFEAWSTDQVEARTLLDPIMLERFQELDRLFEGAKLRAAFSGGKLLVAMEVGDKLSIGSMFTSLRNPERMEKILKEFDLIFDLIDVASRQVTGTMQGAFSIDHVKSA